LINETRLKNRLLELCRIAAPSRFERPIRDYIYQFWQERQSFGLRWQEAPDATIPKGGNTANILLTLDGTGNSSVLLCAHMDTVQFGGADCVAVIEKGGIVRSDGKTALGGDDRAGIALALEMLDCRLESDIAEHDYPTIEVLFTVQEEVGVIGSRVTGFTFKSTICYCLDGETPPGSIITASPRKEQYTCCVHGKTAHAALEAAEGRNAIVHAAKLLTHFPQGQLDEDTTTNVGIIQGGIQTNVVPDEVRIVGEVRSFSEECFAHAKSVINVECRRFDAENGYAVEICWEKNYQAYSISAEEEVVQRFVRACEKSGIKPHILRSRGGGDANNLNAQGIKAVVFGVGMHDIHTPREYLVLDELFSAARLLREVVS
jgi:tripeptide aminopeptidase